MIYRSRMRMTRAVSVTRTRQRSPCRALDNSSEPAIAAFKLPNLAARGVRTLQVSAALDDLPVGDPQLQFRKMQAAGFDVASVPVQ